MRTNTRSLVQRAVMGQGAGADHGIETKKIGCTAVVTLGGSKDVKDIAKEDILAIAEGYDSFDSADQSAGTIECYFGDVEEGEDFLGTVDAQDIEGVSSTSLFDVEGEELKSAGSSVRTKSPVDMSGLLGDMTSVADQLRAAGLGDAEDGYDWEAAENAASYLQQYGNDALEAAKEQNPQAIRDILGPASSALQDLEEAVG